MCVRIPTTLGHKIFMLEIHVLGSPTTINFFFFLTEVDKNGVIAIICQM